MGAIEHSGYGERGCRYREERGHPSSVKVDREPILQKLHSLGCPQATEKKGLFAPVEELYQLRDRQTVLTITYGSSMMPVIIK